mmetsp:Transcript_9873/g.24662  ORF Transcript_9873/g.24662 Transcript_9873/m.24662 type:complete len:225 (-) Transcript_9873:142-816(-)
MTVAGAGAGDASSRMNMSFSSVPYSATYSDRRAATTCCAAATSPGASSRVARASRAIALRLSPPLSAATRAPGTAAVSERSVRASSCTALPRPSWMLSPEWPPSSPPSLSSYAAAPAGAGPSPMSSHSLASPPPAHPMNTSPQSSVSRFSMVRAVSRSAPMPKAPVSPVSSSTVNSASMGGSRVVLGASSSASAVATPIPLSAPRVVPSALSQSPSRTRRMGSL